MIDRRLLEKVTHIYSHAYAGAACADGTAAAILLRDVLEMPVTFLVHGTPELEQLVAKPGQLFVDITPPRERAREFVDAGAIVLDHHVQARDVVELFGERGIYADANTEPGVSGAVLAFREVWSYATTPGSDAYERAQGFAKLAGVRDTWQTAHDDWKASCAQAEALRFYPWRAFAEIGTPFGYTGFADLTKLLAVGPILMERRAADVKRRVGEAFGFATSQGSKVMIVSTVETSDIAEAVGDEADIVIGFEYRDAGERGVTCTLSLRSHTDHDVGAFCKSLKGGGHRAAAGATVSVLADALNPYAMIMQLIEAYERDHVWRAP